MTVSDPVIGAAMLCFTIILVAMIWARTSLNHHLIEAKLKNGEWNQPTKGPEEI